MSNTVSIKIDAKDDSSGAFAKASAEMKAFQSVARESSRTEQKASIDSAAAAAVHEKALRLVADAEKEVGDLSSVTAADVESLGNATEKAAGQVSGLAGGGGGGMQGGGMGALIAAGVGLAPVIVTVGTGLLGLGAAAAGVLEPIKKAASAAGGLQANMRKLDPEQQMAARSLLNLGSEYSSFSQSLKPQVLGLWNEGLKVAGHLMTDVQPIAQATGSALLQVLSGVDREFQSGTWQSFFGFMERTAAPDVQLLGKNFIDLAASLPPLLRDLQPVSQDLLSISDGLIRLTGPTAEAIKGMDATGQHMNFLQHTTALLRTLLFSPGVGLGAALKLLHISGNDAAQGMGTSTTAAQRLYAATGDLLHPLGTVSHGLASASSNADTAAAAAQRTATGIKALTSALSAAMAPLQSYIGATITQANDARAMEKALQASGDRIGYNTANQRASFGAAQTYIGDLVATAQKAIASGQGVDRQTSALGRAIPQLEGVQGKTAAYNAELSQLKHYLDELRAEANITKYVTIVDNVEHIAPGGGLPGGTAGGFNVRRSGGIVGAAGGGPRSGLTLVGEMGPELVRLPTGSSVYNNGQTQGMLGGGGASQVLIQINVPPGGAVLGQEFWTAFGNGIRVRGGSPQIVTKKVVFS